jgi:2-polyprenyl-3-methyl-5-hydroxy-6-metoxy-1,4-benzoquinol methylase
MSNWSEWRAEVDLDEYEARWQQMVDDGANPHGEADFIQRLSPASILDAGCGTGRVAIELARRGIDVEGTDLDADMLMYARRKAPHIIWHESNLSDLNLHRVFDVVALAGNVIPYVGTTRPSRRGGRRGAPRGSRWSPRGWLRSSP